MQKIPDIYSEPSEVSCTVLYDSVSMVNGLKTGKGFSCLIQTGDYSVLFDTGNDGSILLRNLGMLGYNPENIEIVFISHNRYGHVGGLEDFLSLNPNVDVYVPGGFPDSVYETIKNKALRVNKVTEAAEVKPNLFTLGEFAGIFREQAIAIRTIKGIMVIVGCAHHGSIKILERTQEIFPDDIIYLVLGGFHFMGLSEMEKEQILSFFKKIGIKKVAPCHCCDEACRKRFKEVYNKNYIEMGVGGVIKV